MDCSEAVGPATDAELTSVVGQKRTLVRGIRDFRFTPRRDMFVVGINVCYVP